jgi:hypothetical protein
MIAPTAAFVHWASSSFLLALGLSISCVLVRFGILRAMLVSFWAALLMSTSGVLLPPCAIGIEILQGNDFSIGDLVIPVPIVLLSILSLLNLLSHDARSWFFHSSST